MLFAATKINRSRRRNNKAHRAPRQHDEAITVVQTEEVNMVPIIHVHSEASTPVEVDPTSTAKNKAYGMFTETNSTSEYTYCYTNDTLSCNDITTTADKTGSTTDHHNTEEIHMTINESYLRTMINVN